ncbi:hypothetical protein VTN77DRAFT_3589 [Rasamsonia byssochlamydoides]|uniref:uncharacterized protein n=1 Tax=Rasamsonia byssochlamydoides TaxID=89139 RepID=UPI003743723E
MCIALISTAHPSYPLIVLDNRDEYLSRPTAPASWWQEPNSHVLGSRDLARPDQGTWMGVTKQGRIAVLTNYREDAPIGTTSRGAIVNGFLTMPPQSEKSTRQFVVDMIESNLAKKAGGFSLVCGKVNEPLAIVSNRMSHVDGITWIAKEKGETVGLSNTVFGDRSWPKITEGERLMDAAIKAHVESGEGEDGLIRRLLDVLSTDTLPQTAAKASREVYETLLKNSIFIPVIGDREEAAEITAKSSEQSGVMAYMHGLYGTQKQTVLLVSDDGRVKYFERTLYDHNAQAIPIGKGDRVFEFMIEQ